MLTGDSYVVALTCYVLAAILALVLLYRHGLMWAPLGWRRALIGFLSALLLTPVPPGPEATTLAPALIVALFNAAFIDGWASARPAILVLTTTGILGLLAGFATLLVPTRRSTRGAPLDASDKP